MKFGEEKDILSQLQNDLAKNPQVFYAIDGTIALLRKLISGFNTEAVRFIVTNTDKKTTRAEIVDLALRHAFSVPFIISVKKMELDEDNRKELCRIMYILKDAGAELSLKEDPNNQCYLRLLEFMMKHQADILNASDPQRIHSKRCALMFVTRLVNLDQGRSMGTVVTTKIRPETMGKVMTQLKKLVNQADLRTCTDEEVNQLLSSIAPLIQEVIITRDSFVPVADMKVLIELNTELRLDNYIDNEKNNNKNRE